MKKAISLILCVLVICMSLTACSSHSELTQDNIAWTVDEAFDALKSFDVKNLEKYVNSKTLKIIMTYAKKHQQFVDLGKAIFSGLEYEITDINVDNKTVTVSVKNKDLAVAADNFANQLSSEYTVIELIRNLNNEEFLDSKLNVLTTEISNAPLSDEATEITLSVSKSENNLVLNFNDEAEDAVSGKALNAVKGAFNGGF